MKQNQLISNKKKLINRGISLKKTLETLQSDLQETLAWYIDEITGETVNIVQAIELFNEMDHDQIILWKERHRVLKTEFQDVGKTYTTPKPSGALIAASLRDRDIDTILLPAKIFKLTDFVFYLTEFYVLKGMDPEDASAKAEVLIQAYEEKYPFLVEEASMPNLFAKPTKVLMYTPDYKTMFASGRVMIFYKRFLQITRNTELAAALKEEIRFTARNYVLSNGDLGGQIGRLKYGIEKPRS